MPRKSESEPCLKHTLLLFEGDFARLQELYPEVGASIIIRRLVRKHIKEVEGNLATIKLKETPV